LSTALQTDYVDNFKVLGGAWHLQCSLAIIDKRYILFISFINPEGIMSQPSTRKPTKKAFHFPKHANGHAKADEKQADEENAPAAAAPDAEPAPTKVAKPKRAKPVDAAPVSPAADVKAKRARKEKVVRDSFTMPKSDYEKIASLKQKCLDAGVSVKKSELLRAGLHLLDSAPAKRLVAAISAVETVKTGRPSKS
jgi:hypothetical protein